MRECNACKDAGFLNQLIGFEKLIEDSANGKNNWKQVGENGNEHKHKFILQNTTKVLFQRRMVVDIDTVTDIQEAKKLLLQGCENKISYHATISIIFHYVSIKDNNIEMENTSLYINKTY